jgi:hypothetical protein
MTRRAPTFTTAQISRAARGAMKAGLSVARLEIDATGKIIVICGDAPPPAAPPDGFEGRLRSATEWAK